jgi:nucleoside-diphosphate-sugar epimerase
MRRLPDTLPENIEVDLGDLGDPEAVDRAVRGVTHVVHCGAAMRGPWSDHLRGTIVGTRNVLNACRTHSVRKLVHISSLSVVRWIGKRDEPLDEHSPLEPHAAARGAYTRAKLEAERLVMQCCTGHQLCAVVLRPGQIHGGGIPVLTSAVARRIGKRWLVLGDGKLRLPLVHIDDVVENIVRALECSAADGSIVQIVDECTPTQNQVLRAECGPAASVIHVPRTAVFALGKISEWAFGLLRRTSPLSVYRLRSALARRTFSGHSARRLLGWRPRAIGAGNGTLNADLPASLGGGWANRGHPAGATSAVAVDV